MCIFPCTPIACFTDFALTFNDHLYLFLAFTYKGSVKQVRHAHGSVHMHSLCRGFRIEGFHLMESFRGMDYPGAREDYT